MNQKRGKITSLNVNFSTRLEQNNPSEKSNKKVIVFFDQKRAVFKAEKDVFLS